jgi:hypothetical protein
MQNIKNIARKRVWRVLALLLIDIIFFGSTNTTKVASYLVIVGFLLLTMSFYQVIYYFLSFIKLYGIPIKRKSHLAIYLTVVLGILVALQSIGELSPKDIIVLLPLAAVGYVYSSYMKPTKQKNI